MCGIEGFKFGSWERMKNPPASSAPQPSPATQPSAMPQSSANLFMPTYSDGQQPLAQQQAQPASMPRATPGRFSFNQGSLRIGDSTMNASDSGLNI
jgi:hypothetical protein